MKKENGITLIILVITIMIIVLLATVSLKLSIGQNGLIEQAGNVKNTHGIVSEREAIQRAYNVFVMDDETGENNADVLKVSGAEVTGNRLSGWKIFFLDTGNSYKLLANGEIKDPSFDENWKQNQDGSFSKGSTEGLKIGDRIKYEKKLQDVTLTQDSKLIQDLKEYSGATLSTLNNPDKKKKKKDLEWEVFDIKDGKIRIISSTPTISTLGLKGANGYNNAVYLIDEACDVLYTTQGIGNAKNLKIEDIEEKINTNEFDYTQCVNRNVSPSLTDNEVREYTEGLEYPNIYKNEIGCLAISSSNNNGELGLSEQQEFVKGSSNATGRLVTTNTYWFKLMNKNYFVDYKNSNSYYYSLLINNGEVLSYWLSSRCVGCHCEPFVNSNGTITYYNDAEFLVRIVSNNGVRGADCLISNGFVHPGVNPSYKLRPVVTLDINVELTGNSTDGWEIE